MKDIQKKVEDDCLSCKVTGFCTFAGVGAYAWHLRSTTPLSNPRYRVFYAVFSASFSAMVVARVTLM